MIFQLPRAKPRHLPRASTYLVPLPRGLRSCDGSGTLVLLQAQLKDGSVPAAHAVLQGDLWLTESK